MKVFTKIGELVIKLFDFIGMIIWEIPNIQNSLKGVNTDKVNTDTLKDNYYKIKDNPQN